VQVVDGGSATITSNDILDIRHNPLDGVQTGVGVLIGGLSLSDGPGTALVADNTISGYQKGGVVAIGEGTSATIVGNSITGVGPTGVIAQNGVQVSEGADANVIGNRISKNNYTGDETFASGVIVDDAGDVTVALNELTRNNIGIFARVTDDVKIVGNDVRSSTSDGIFLFDLSGALVSGTGRATTTGPGSTCSR